MNGRQDDPDAGPVALMGENVKRRIYVPGVCRFSVAINLLQMSSDPLVSKYYTELGGADIIVGLKAPAIEEVRRELVLDYRRLAYGSAGQESQLFIAQVGGCHAAQRHRVRFSCVFYARL